MTTILILGGIGILTLLAELVLPGGLLGIVSALCLVGAVIATYATYGISAGTAAFAILVVIGLASISIWMKLFHRLPFTRKLILDDAVGVDATLLEKQNLTGQKGIALTDLMPSGRGEFEGRRIDVVTEGPSIQKGAGIEVIATRGPSIIVREIHVGN